MNRLLILAILSILAWPAWGTGGPVVVLLSDTEPAYEQPLTHFRAKLENDIEVYNLEGDIEKAPEVMNRILARKPALILALGAKAAYFAKAATGSHQEIPVIFAMVLNWQRYQLLEGQTNIAGINSDISPGTQLLAFNLLFPEIKRVGVFYSNEHTAKTIEEATQAAKLIGLEIEAYPIERAKELKRGYRQLAGKVDAIWLLTDPVIYTLDNMHWMARQCLKDRLICIGQSNNIVRLGMLLSVSPNIPSIGNQAASIAENILSHNARPEDIAVQDPLGTRLILNADTAQKIGLELPESALNMADEVIGK